MTQDFSKLTRPRYPMPDDVQAALVHAGVTQDYAARPAYQQNDYLGWIERAKRRATREKRIVQMINELQTGGVYMNMPHPASQKSG